MFTSFAYTPPDEAFRKCFSMSLSNLVDSLAVFAASDGVADLSLRWPDRDGRLLLQLSALRDAGGDGAEGGVVDSCTYAEISCEVSTFAEDLEGEMMQPRSQFTLQARICVCVCSSAASTCVSRQTPGLLQSGTLRELVDDLEWACSPVCIEMKRDPPALSFTARGGVTGDAKAHISWV